MVDSSNQITVKLLELMKDTGYPIIQHNGQRKYGPPYDWTGPPPPRGCEVFIGKLPRNIYEDELVPLFSKVGKIYELRLMMDFSGSNRGYAFVTYATRSEAAAAVSQLNGHEIRPRRHLGVVKSVDNCRLFVGNIPKTKTKEELFKELSKLVNGIVDVILYKNCFDRKLNRGFAFVEFTSHRAAAMARRELVPGCVKLWDQEVVVDWAEPEPDVDDEQMKKVKVLYARNFQITTTPEVIQQTFETAINKKIERVNKIYDYAFINFYEREHAELALAKLQNIDVDGTNIEICWAKPVNHEIYRIQKINRGNAKFNNSLNLSQTFLLYKQHMEKRENPDFSKDEGISSTYAGDSLCHSPSDLQQLFPWTMLSGNYKYAPAKLEEMCKRHFWALPIYKFRNHVDTTGRKMWVCTIELPQIGTPLFTVPRSIGPLISRTCYTDQQAYVEAAEIAINILKMLRVEAIQQSVAPQPMYCPVLPMQNLVKFPYDYTSIYMQTQQSLQMPLPTVWRAD